MGSKRMVIYVTLLEDSKTVEHYAVHETAAGGSDLWNDGHCSSSRAPLAVFRSVLEWLEETTGERLS